MVEPASVIITFSFKSKFAKILIKSIVCLIGTAKIIISAKGANSLKSDVAGLGLIGASLALGIKRGHPDYKVIGYNRSDKSREVAQIGRASRRERV